MEGEDAFAAAEAAFLAVDTDTTDITSDTATGVITSTPTGTNPIVITSDEDHDVTRLVVNSTLLTNDTVEEFLENLESDLPFPTAAPSDFSDIGQVVTAEPEFPLTTQEAFEPQIDPEGQDIDFGKVEKMLEKVWPGQWGQIISVNGDVSCSDLSTIRYGLEDGDRIVYHIDFPEVEITNSKRHSHLIKDLTVVLEFKQQPDGLYKFVHNIKGIRRTQSAIEHSGGYKHSHLPGGSGVRLESFCLGGGTEMAMMSLELKDNFTLDMFEVFLYMIGHYVKYESIEGGPYRRMAQIAYQNGRDNSYFSTSDTDVFCQAVMQNLTVDSFSDHFNHHVFDKATTSEGPLGHTLSLNLTKNIPLLTSLVPCVSNDRHIVTYNEGNFTPKDSGRGRDQYTEDFCNSIRQEIYTSRNPLVSEYGEVTAHYQVIPEVFQEVREDVDVPMRAFVKELETRLQDSYRMYLNVKQNY